MTHYEAKLEIPMNMHGAELNQFVDALREFGHPIIVVRIEADSKRDAVENIANSTSPWWYRYKYTREWWQEKIRVKRNPPEEV